MKRIASLALIIFGLSLPAYMVHETLGAFHYARNIVASTNASTAATAATYADCYSGGPAACGDAEEMRQIAIGQAALAAR